MHPRITESLSLLRNVPPAFRRPSRLTYGVAAATAATAALTAVAVTGAPGTGPVAATAAHRAGSLAAASDFRGVSPAVATAVSGQHVSQPAQSRPARAVHTVRVHPAPAARAQVAMAAEAHPQGASHEHHEHHARHAARPHARTVAKAEHAPQQHPYRVYDSTTPGSIPARQAAAVYSNGRYYATPEQVGHLGHTMWIDITGRNYSASVLDVEPGDATPSQAASWVWHRLHANPHALVRVYTFQNEWPAVKAAMKSLPSWMQARVHWWIADPTGSPHMVPGASATQWYWGSSYDLSTALPGF